MSQDTVRLEITAQDADTVRNFMRTMLNEHMSDEYNRAVADTEEHKRRADIADFNAGELRTHNKELFNEIASLTRKNADLVREAGITSADVISKSYKDGERDGRAEARQEQVSMKQSHMLANMLAHNDVMVTLERARVPFHFRPAFLTTFERMKALVPDKELPHHQRELIGTQLSMIGVFGMNMLTHENMFIVACDSWTLYLPPLAPATAPE